jgi:two-component system nitrogen regulation response regulator GlnG
MEDPVSERYGVGEGARGRVLVVEAHVHNGRFMRRILWAHGYGVVLAADARGAWAAIEDGVPDVVVSDVDAWDDQGRWLVTEVRARFPRMPIVVTSAMNEDLISLVRRGATALLPKPFHPEDLLSVVRIALSESVRRMPAAAPVEARVLGRTP